MKNYRLPVAFLIVIIAIAVWGFFSPNGVRAAVVNNLWSIQNLRFQYESPGSTQPAPPATHLHAPIFLAMQAIDAADYNRASAYLQPLVDASDPLAINSYARILFLQGDYTSAFNLWEKQGNTSALIAAASELPEDAADLRVLAYKSLVKINPQKYTIELAIRMRGHSDPDELVRVLKDSIERYPGAPHHSLWIRYLGDVYVEQGKTAEAEATYRQAVSVNPREYEAWRNLGLLYYGSSDRFMESVEPFLKCIELDPQGAFPYLLLANVYERDGQPEVALRYFQDVLQLDPENPQALEGIKRLSN